MVREVIKQLKLAIRAHDYKLVVNLTKCHHFTQKELDSLLSTSVNSGDTDIIKYLNTVGAHYKEQHVNVAIIQGHYEVVKLLVSFGVFINGVSLMNIAEHGNLELLEWLLNWDHKMPMDTSFICSGAARGGHLNILQWAIARGYSYKFAFNNLISNVTWGIPLNDGHIACAYYLYNLDSTNCTINNFYYTKCNNDKFRSFMHYTGYKSFQCIHNTCTFCNEKEIFDMWTLESKDCTNYIQWLPPEMIDDVTSLLHIKHQ